MALEIDLDFQRYVERRRGALEQQVREGAAYAYGADTRFKKTLDTITPVRVAIEATVRLWKSTAKDELLVGAERVTPHKNAKLDALTELAAKALHVTRPDVFLSASFEGTHTFGAEGETTVLLGRALVDSLTEDELLFVIGRQCGHIQNDQVVLSTAQYYLVHAGNRFVKWVVTPAAAALSAWSRRADITCDRAGLIAGKSLDASEAALRKLLSPEAADVRVAALRIFAESAYYKGLVGQDGGLTQAEVDGKVGEVLST
ncbi:MAG: M48 family metalloprotease [Polyangia bacterium]